MKLFVWDFHGVLEKGNDLAVLDITNQVLAAHRYNIRLDIATNSTYYGLKWYEYFERLLPDLTHEQCLALQAECFVCAEDNLDVIARHMRPTDFAADVLKTVKEAGHDQILLSNTRSRDLIWFVENVGLQEYLPPVKQFGVNAHEKLGTKQNALETYVKNRDFDGLVIIGDSEKDMILKRVCGGTTYFYTHPHLTAHIAVEADYRITDLRQVLNEIS